MASSGGVSSASDGALRGNSGFDDGSFSTFPTGASEPFNVVQPYEVDLVLVRVA
jgi:hypothetical protein